MIGFLKLIHNLIHLIRGPPSTPLSPHNTPLKLDPNWQLFNAGFSRRRKGKDGGHYHQEQAQIDDKSKRTGALTFAHMPKCLNAQMPTCPNAQTSKCPNVQMPKCQNVQTPKRPNVQMPKFPQVSKHPNAQMPKCPNAQMPKCPNAQMPR